MKKQYFMPSLLILTSCLCLATPDSVHFGIRTGVDLTAYSGYVKPISSVAFTDLLYMGNLSFDIMKPLSPSYTAGISGTYNYLYIPEIKHSTSIFRTGLSAFYNISTASQIGLSTTISHASLHEEDKEEDTNLLFGYLNNVLVGVNIKNFISEQLFTHVELMYDVTPSMLEPLGLLPHNYSTLVGSHLISNIKATAYSVNVSIGYSIDSESLSLDSFS